MKPICCIALLVAAAAPGSGVGDTFQQVIAEKGNPKSQIEAGSIRILNYTDVTIRVRDNLVVSIVSAPPPSRQKSAPPQASVQAPSPQAQVAALKRERDQTILLIQGIVNQPVTALHRTSRMRVTVFSPGWFHEGAIKPDFDKVDVRATQQAVYDSEGYVSSDLNPEVAFVGSELEFNPMTKYFYADRSIPKKKLTEPEMLEINRLYRILGRCERQLAQLQAR